MLKPPPMPCMNTKGLTILTWNVLLPNSVDGWWLYKYYGANTPQSATTWDVRRELMKERLLSANPDVICLQETSEKSFASDFSFLHKAGYDCAILSKGRMRPATFWRRGLLELVCADGSRPEPIPPPSPTLSDDGGPTGVPSFIESSFTCKVTYEAWVKKTRDQAAKAAKAAGEAGETAADPEAIALARMTAVANDAVRGGAVVLNGDRILTTMLRHVSIDSADPSPPPPPIFVLNCHLSAGSEARRRLRQVSDALDAVRKLLAKVSPAGAAAAKGGDKGGGGKGGGGKGGGDKGGGNKGDGKGGAKAKGGGAASSSSSVRPPAIVVCGDFNSQGKSGVRELLMRGEVLPTFRESGDPTEGLQGFTGAESREEVTSKAKRQSFGLFADAAEEAYRASAAEGAGTGQTITTTGAIPPTIVASELMSVMVDYTSGDGRPSAALTAKVDEMFDAISSDGSTFTPEEEARWLTMINQATTRGSEMRKAKALREERQARECGSAESAGGGGASGGARLHREDFHAVYADELAQGKYWGVEHDLRVVTGTGLASPTEPPFTATFDYLYYTQGAMKMASMLPALTTEQYEEILKPGGSILPNEWFPSDHLPVAAALEFVE